MQKSKPRYVSTYDENDENSLDFWFFSLSREGKNPTLNLWSILFTKGWPKTNWAQRTYLFNGCLQKRWQFCVWQYMILVFMSTLKCMVKTELDTLNLFDPLNLIFNVKTFCFLLWLFGIHGGYRMESLSLYSKVKFYLTWSVSEVEGLKWCLANQSFFSGGLARPIQANSMYFSCSMKTYFIWHGQFRPIWCSMTSFCSGSSCG